MKKNVEDQICAELFALESNNNESNTKRTQATVEEDFDSLKNKLTRYLRKQVAPKNQDPLI
ncbi:2545_t:CDS:2 [Cetraspora pellucida]|uniref:2545_t:CDS:1 n=1 Tax=Cetraspora pellucida TaxID=1433469 RepID=A0A9N9HLQ0_9GLOM|nr:2545_t:CDS:2 [Cetraspora pellucida]